MILDEKTGELTEGTFFRKTYWLTQMQTKLLAILSDNECHTYEELWEKLEVSPATLRVHLCTLRKKVKNLSIKTQRGLWLKLIDIVVLK